MSEESRKSEIQRRARKLIHDRGWIVGDSQTQLPYGEFHIGNFWLTLDIQGHLQIRRNSIPQEGYRGLVYDQRDSTNEGFLFLTELGEQCLKLMRETMILEDLADV